MTHDRFARQPDLFAPQTDLFDGRTNVVDEEPPPDDFIQRIRDELNATLALAQAAETFPWPDATRTLLTEMRFKSIAGWLPAVEADALRAAFAAEMARLYAADAE